MINEHHEVASHTDGGELSPVARQRGRHAAKRGHPQWRERAGRIVVSPVCLGHAAANRMGRFQGGHT